MVTISFRAAETGDTGQAVEAACQPARKPLAGWRLPEGRGAALARRPFPFPFVCVCMFFSGVIFCVTVPVSVFFLFFLFGSLLFMASGRRPGGADCGARSPRSCCAVSGFPL
ncbi:hypothetical protein AWP83_24210 [Escherichia coli]|nr:hypothetical protein AWP83_24210 [Escherichia coli]